MLNKFKVGDTVQLVYNGRTFSDPTYFEVVKTAKEDPMIDPFIVVIRESGTKNAPSVIDVSLIRKATP